MASICFCMYSCRTLDSYNIWQAAKNRASTLIAALWCSMSSCEYGAADLQVADSRRAVDPHVGGVGRGHLGAVFEPKHWGSGVSVHLAADVGWVSLPRVHRHGTQDLWSICRSTQRGKDGQLHGALHRFLCVFFCPDVKETSPSWFMCNFIFNQCASNCQLTSIFTSEIMKKSTNFQHQKQMFIQ